MLLKLAARRWDLEPARDADQPELAQHLVVVLRRAARVDIYSRLAATLLLVAQKL